MKSTMTGLGMSLICLLHLPAEAAEPPAASEIWAIRYHAGTLDPAGDGDGDGLSNAEESVAGTDPLDGTSFPRAVVTAIIGSKVHLDVASQPEKAYQIYKSESPAGPWTKHGGKARASSELLQVTASKMGPRGFYHLQVSDDDSDRDGLTDWEESQLAGFSPHDDDSFGTGKKNGDDAVAREMITALRNGVIRVEATTPVAYEAERIPAVITLSRESNTGYPFTLFFRTRAAGELPRSSAAVSDYQLSDGSGQPPSGRVVIPAGQSSLTIHVIPTPDSLREVPEELRLSVGGMEESVAVSIRDALPSSTNHQWFAANLRPAFGSGSLGSGTATIRLPADHDLATLALSFSNLRSPVTAVRVETTDGDCLCEIELADYGALAWPIRASGPFASDQAVLDALCSGQVALTVATERNVTGEIKGVFAATSGGNIFAIPPPPPALEALAGTELDQDIARFLTQATFGATMADIEDLRTRVAAHSGDRLAAFGEWIDEQFARPSPSLLALVIAADRQDIEVRASLPTDHPDYHPSYEPECLNRIRGWWVLARHAPDQLRQRAAFALSEIFVVSDKDPHVYWHPHGTASYHDMLRLGCSGSYRDLLSQVARHPIMGLYLSHLRNGKAVMNAAGQPVTSPDENFARELMQLFSIGLVELHPDGSVKVGPDVAPIPTYGQEDVAAMARVFTGWSFSVVNSPADSDRVADNTNFHQGNGLVRREAQWTHPMAMFPAYHDTGAKAVLGLSLPGGQSGEQELAAVLDHLAEHPNTAPFICRRLIQRLVTANPSPGYLFRASTAFTSSGGNLAATIKAILLDPEARTPATAFTGAGCGKKREPLLRHLAFLRAFDGGSRLLLSDLAAFGYPAEELALFPAGANRLLFWNTDHWLNQSPQSAPSVFNWYSPDFMPAGILTANGLTSPELKLTNENSYVPEINLNCHLIFGAVFMVRLPGQDLPPRSYAEGDQYLRIDFDPLEACYLAAVDTNGDGQFSSLDTESFGNPAAIATACEAVVDRLDLLLCAGALKVRHGDTPGRPRRIILDAVAGIQSANSGIDHGGYQAFYMRERIRNALWLVMTSPDAAIQK